MWMIDCAEAGSRESIKYLQEGWEPFAVTVREKIESVVWFRKQRDSDDPLVGQVYPVVLREDMKTLLAYARNNDQCDDGDDKIMDAIAQRWRLE